MNNPNRTCPWINKTSKSSCCQLVTQSLKCQTANHLRPHPNALLVGQQVFSKILLQSNKTQRKRKERARRCRTHKSKQLWRRSPRRIWIASRSRRASNATIGPAITRTQIGANSLRDTSIAIRRAATNRLRKTFSRFGPAMCFCIMTCPTRKPCQKWRKWRKRKQMTTPSASLRWLGFTLPPLVIWLAFWALRRAEMWKNRSEQPDWLPQPTYTLW